ncbi:permease [Alicyclobacillus ferrooxydans]|uniref:Permease n=1 Tax=Alicyclobacillus ferrooxydans TaxID=471514 RepID=A0A0P9EWL1_9BACL|nr:permease [Alicyclobacillus ferrooxydans]KPV43500.1 hypothetical protein AN477_11830 [Alicyclobacillus ferrooxydans]
MDIVLIAMGFLTLLGYVVMAIIRPQTALSGLDASTEMFVQAVPWIVVSMFAAGLIAQWLQPQLIARWLGREAGFGGILLGTLLGLFGTGSRWAMYPLAAGMFAADASPGAVFAFVTTWQLVSLPRLPAEIPFYGVNFTVVRAIVSVVIALIGGIVVNRWLA